MADNMSTTGDTMMNVEDNISAVEAVQYTGGYHEYNGGVMRTRKDVQYIGVSIQIQLFSH